MATYNVTFNTEDKSCTVSKDGVEMEKVDSLNIYKEYDGKHSLEVHQKLENEDKSYTYIRTTAEKSYEVSSPTVSEAVLTNIFTS